MAATLAWIKSRLILPPPDDAEDDEGLDPRAELVARLLEYQRFKEVPPRSSASARGSIATCSRLIGSRARSPRPTSEREIKVGMVQLLEAYRRVLQGARPAGSGPARGRGRERHRARAHGGRDERDRRGTSRSSSSASSSSRKRVAVATRPIVVTSFLAILELTRLAAIRIYQGVDEDLYPEGPIRLRKHEVPGSDWAEDIAEIM